MVSGAPGSGKSHTAVAVAIDAVDRGASVLVAAQSDHAVEVIGDLVARHPGPAPVLFGNAERRDAIAAELAAGLPGPQPGRAFSALEQAARKAAADVSRLEGSIMALLDRERSADEAARHDALVPSLAAIAPGAFDLAADLAALERLVARATAEGRGPLSR